MIPYRKIFGFVASGALASGAYAVLYAWATLYAGMPVFFGSLFAFLLATPVSYFGNRWITYRSRNVMGPESLRFLTVQLINLVVTAFVVHAASKLFALTTTSQIVVACVSAPLVSLVLYELWVYRQRMHGPANTESQR